MRKTFKLAIAGGRRFENKEKAYKLLDHMLERKDMNSDIVILAGSNRGNNKIAKRYAATKRLDLEIIDTDWFHIPDNRKELSLNGKINRTYSGKEYYVDAWKRRDNKLIKDADAIVAFWNGHDKDIEYDIFLSLYLFKKPIRVFDYDLQLLFSVNNSNDREKAHDNMCISCSEYQNNHCHKHHKKISKFNAICIDAKLL